MANVCKVCVKHFSRKSNLNRHVMCVHENKRYQCPVCNKQFKRRYLLPSHMNLHECGPTVGQYFDTTIMLIYNLNCLIYQLYTHIINIFVKRYCVPCSEFLSLPFKHIPMHYHMLSVHVYYIAMLFQHSLVQITSNQHCIMQVHLMMMQSRLPVTIQMCQRRSTEEIIRVFFLNKNLQ